MLCALCATWKHTWSVEGFYVSDSNMFILSVRQDAPYWVGLIPDSNRAEEEKQAAMDIKNMVPLREAISSWDYYCLIPWCKDCSKNKKP